MTDSPTIDMDVANKENLPDVPNVRKLIKTFSSASVFDTGNSHEAIHTIRIMLEEEVTDIATILDDGIMTHAKKLLSSPVQSVRKDTCWILSEIAAGTESQIDALFDGRYGCVERVNELAATNKEESRKEALSVIINIIAGGSIPQLKALERSGGSMTISKALASEDPEIQVAALDLFPLIANMEQDELDCLKNLHRITM